MADQSEFGVQGASIRSKGGGNSPVISVRSAAILTLNYVAGTVINIQNADQLTLQVDFTLGSSSGCNIKVEVSDDNVTFYEIPFFEIINSEAVYAGLSFRMNATGKLAISFPMSNYYCKISSKALVDATGTSLAISAVKSNL